MRTIWSRQETDRGHAIASEWFLALATNPLAGATEIAQSAVVERRGVGTAGGNAAERGSRGNFLPKFGEPIRCALKHKEGALAATIVAGPASRSAVPNAATFTRFSYARPIIRSFKTHHISRTGGLSSREFCQHSDSERGYLRSAYAASRMRSPHKQRSNQSAIVGSFSSD
jgi:hypothetical protein